MTYFALALRSQGTPGLWWHTCRPIQFLLIVDDFGVEYIEKQHAENLSNVFTKYHEISREWESKNFSGIDLQWNYPIKHCDKTCRLSMK